MLRSIIKVVKVIWHTATLPPQTEGSIVFGRLCQCAPHLIYSSLDPPDSASQNARQSVQPYLQGSRQRVPILYNGPPFPLKIAPLRGVDLNPHLIHGSLGPPKSTTQRTSRSLQPFCRAHDCDRLTNRPRYSICHNRPHLRGTAMQPKK